jgi:hypothetical protein
MDELKNIRTFQEFKESAVNEEALWDAIKNLFSTLFGKMDKKFSDAINNFTKKLDGSKNWEDAVKAFQEMEKEYQIGFQADMGMVKGPLGLRKLLTDSYTSMYLMCQEMSKCKFQPKDMAANVVFKGHPDEKIFAYPKAEDFKKNLLNAMNAKVIALNKDANMGGPYWDEKALEQYLTNANNNKELSWDDVNKVETGGASPTTGTPGGDKNAVKQNLPGGQPTEKYDYISKEKLNEEADPNAKPADPNAKPADPNAKPADPNAKPADPNAKPADPNAKPADPNAKPADPSKPPELLKDKKLEGATQSLQKFVNEQLLGYSFKKLQAIKPPSKVGTDDAFLSLSKDSKVSDNKDSIAKLMKAIRDLPPDKKADLIRIRAELGKALGKTEDEMKKEYPL